MDNNNETGNESTRNDSTTNDINNMMKQEINELNVEANYYLSTYSEISNMNLY